MLAKSNIESTALARDLHALMYIRTHTHSNRPLLIKISDRFAWQELERRLEVDVRGNSFWFDQSAWAEALQLRQQVCDPRNPSLQQINKCRANKPPVNL